MTIERAVLLLAGVLTLTGLALAYLLSPWWALLSVFVGLNLAQTAFTGFCPAAIIFRQLGLRSGQPFR